MTIRTKPVPFCPDCGAQECGKPDEDCTCDISAFTLPPLGLPPYAVDLGMLLLIAQRFRPLCRTI